MLHFIGLGFGLFVLLFYLLYNFFFPFGFGNHITEFFFFFFLSPPSHHFSLSSLLSPLCQNFGDGITEICFFSQISLNSTYSTNKLIFLQYLVKRLFFVLLFYLLYNKFFFFLIS